MTQTRKNRILRILGVLLAAVILLCAAFVPQAEAAATASYYENAVLFWTNVERSRHGLDKLRTSSPLIYAAGARSDELTESYSHTRPNGKAWKTALTSRDIDYSYAAENIARNYKTPCEVVTGWMNSEGHRDNILNKHYTHMGVGHSKSDSGAHYWCQLMTGGASFSDSKSTYSVSPTGVSVDRTKVSLSVGGTTTVTGTPSPVYATSVVTCKSSDSSIVKVTGTEVNHFTIKGVARGTATLTVKCGSYSKTVKVTVGSGASSFDRGVTVNPTVTDMDFDFPGLDIFINAFGKNSIFEDFLDAFVGMVNYPLK